MKHHKTERRKTISWPRRKSETEGAWEKERESDSRERERTGPGFRPVSDSGRPTQAGNSGRAGRWWLELLHYGAERTCYCVWATGRHGLGSGVKRDDQQWHGDDISLATLAAVVMEDWFWVAATQLCCWWFRGMRRKRKRKVSDICWVKEDDDMALNKHIMHISVSDSNNKNNNNNKQIISGVDMEIGTIIALCKIK